MLYCLSSKVSLKVDVSSGQEVKGCKYKRPWEFRGCNICVEGGNLLNLAVRFCPERYLSFFKCKPQ